MAVSAATIAKITSAVASDKNARKVIGIIIGSIIGLLLIPLIAYMGIIDNMDSIEIDTNQVQQSIIQNISTEEKAKLQHVENVMNEISKECSKRKLKSIVSKKAQAVYACAFYDVEKSDNDFISKLVDCFEQVNTSVFSDEKDSKDSDISRQNKTAKKIGKEYNISHGTVEKYSRFAKSIDVIDKKVPGMADFLMSGKLKISHSNIEEISKLSPKQIKQLFVSIESYGQNTPPGMIRREFSNIKSHSNVPLAEIKKVPKYNPDSELTTLYYTIPSWCESISSTQRKVDFNAVSSEVKGKLINELKRLNKNVQSILNEITEEKNGK